MQFCSACHQFPPPATLPKDRWPDKVSAMFEIARAGAEHIAGAPPEEAVARYYSDRAPKILPSIDSTFAKGPGPARLDREPIRVQGFPSFPAVANVQIVRLHDPAGGPELLVTDMRFGHVLALRLADGKVQGAYKVGDVPHPARSQVADVDGDGLRDVLVANLGTVTPSDATNGSVEWFRAEAPTRFRRVALLENVGRVADVRAADFDKDGDQDVLVGIFGWRKVGRVVLLENQGAKGSATPRFVERLIDGRPGSICVPIVDLDRDGNLDFVTVFSQQFETVVAFLGDGKGGFRAKSLFQASHPNWGFCWLEVVDMDGDGDDDLLASNGDTLDDLVVKPYHGIQWLENRGEMRFETHQLTKLYGAHTAKAGDIDGDGDLDIVAGAFLPYVRADTPSVERVESLIWLEQRTGGRFERHSLETRTPYHPTLAIGDVDGDGDSDIVTGSFTMAKRKTDTIDHLLMLHRNRTTQ